MTDRSIQSRDRVENMQYTEAAGRKRTTFLEMVKYRL
jgi:hypothetical protein